MCWNCIELRRDATLASVRRDRREMGCLDVAETVLSERSSVQKRKEGRGNYSYRRPVCSHHPLRSARLYRSGGRVEVVNEGEPRDRIWETVDVDTAGLQPITQLQHIL